MAPIRVGFIGLSKVGWGPAAHLPYLLANPDKYSIVAICNTSVESSRRAIELYGLPEETKAYGDAKDLANDENVDLVVCTVQVQHYIATITPILKKGKNMFVEWPLGRDLKEAKDLLALKQEHGTKRAIVSLQARQDPMIAKLKEIIDGGRVGKVLSSQWVGFSGFGGDIIENPLKILLQKGIGPNLVSIHFGHSIDYIQKTLGYGFQAPPKSLLTIARGTVKLYEDMEHTKLIDPAFPNEAVDTVFLNGILKSGIPLSVSLRCGKPFKGQPGLDWRIYGEKGEIRITGGGPCIGAGDPDLKVEIHDFDKSEVEKVEWDNEQGGVAGLALRAKDIGRIYQQYWKGEDDCTFEDAVDRHALIEQIYEENGIEY